MDGNESSKGKNVTTLFSYDSIYSADSVEWCPHEPALNYFVCANYQLENNINVENSIISKGHTKRSGKVLLFSISASYDLKLEQDIITAAVLDQKWCHKKIDNFSILAVANAIGKVEIYRLNQFKLELLTHFTFPVEETETLILSLDWSTGKYEDTEPLLVCSDSKGNIHTLKFLNNELILEKTWHGHDFEAWISGFYYWDINILFSGGDDCLFLKFDRRVDDGPVAKNRTHGAGVTAIHCNKSREHILATGSYDEHVRLWDMRNMKRPSKEMKTPGTLWRLKWDPFSQDFLLAACMLGGVHVIDVKENEEMSIVASYLEHKNIAYGADWSYLNESEVRKFDKDGNFIIGTCSFYDHLLCVSKLALKID